jgi:hypothetical protein
VRERGRVDERKSAKERKGRENERREWEREEESVRDREGG